MDLQTKAKPEESDSKDRRPQEAYPRQDSLNTFISGLNTRAPDGMFYPPQLASEREADKDRSGSQAMFNIDGLSYGRRSSEVLDQFNPNGRNSRAALTAWKFRQPSTFPSAALGEALSDFDSFLKRDSIFVGNPMDMKDLNFDLLPGGDGVERGSRGLIGSLGALFGIDRRHSKSGSQSWLKPDDPNGGVRSRADSVFKEYINPDQPPASEEPTSPESNKRTRLKENIFEPKLESRESRDYGDDIAGDYPPDKCRPFPDFPADPTAYSTQPAYRSENLSPERRNSSPRSVHSTLHVLPREHPSYATHMLPHEPGSDLAKAGSRTSQHASPLPKRQELTSHLSPSMTLVSPSYASDPNGTDNLLPAHELRQTDDGRPLLGATKIDQLMLVIQARTAGVSKPIPRAPDGSILDDGSILPTPTLLVGGIEKPKLRGPKAHICGHCGKPFTQLTHLEVHIRSHIGLKPFSCNFCGKKFTQGGNLRTHLRLHTGEKPFKCDLCNREFSRKGNLAAHKLTHEKHRPFECKLEDCDKLFTQLGNLKSHQNRFHLESVKSLTDRLADLGPDMDMLRLPDDEKYLLEYFKDLYKNSNRGIKGRGKKTAGTVAAPAGRPPNASNQAQQQLHQQQLHQQQLHQQQLRNQEMSERPLQKHLQDQHPQQHSQPHPQQQQPHPHPQQHPHQHQQPHSQQHPQQHSQQQQIHPQMARGMQLENQRAGYGDLTSYTNPAYASANSPAGYMMYQQGHPSVNMGAQLGYMPQHPMQGQQSLPRQSDKDYAGSFGY